MNYDLAFLAFCLTVIAVVAITFRQPELVSKILETFGGLQSQTMKVVWQTLHQFMKGANEKQPLSPMPLDSGGDNLESDQDSRPDSGGDNLDESDQGSRPDSMTEVDAD